MQRSISIFLVLLFLAGCHTWKVRNALDEVVDVSGMALTSVFVHTYNWVDSAEGTDMLCKDLAEEKKQDYASGSYSDEDFERDCGNIVKDFEERFDTALEASSKALLSLEHILDLWKEGLEFTDQEGTQKVTIAHVLRFASHALLAFRDLEECLKEAGVPIPDELVRVIGLLSGFATDILE